MISASGSGRRHPPCRGPARRRRWRPTGRRSGARGSVRALAPCRSPPAASLRCAARRPPAAPPRTQAAARAAHRGRQRRERRRGRRGRRRIRRGRRRRRIRRGGGGGGEGGGRAGRAGAARAPPPWAATTAVGDHRDQPTTATAATAAAAAAPAPALAAGEGPPTSGARFARGGRGRRPPKEARVDGGRRGAEQLEREASSWKVQCMSAALGCGAAGGFINITPHRDTATEQATRGPAGSRRAVYRRRTHKREGEGGRGRERGREREGEGEKGKEAGKGMSLPDLTPRLSIPTGVWGPRWGVENGSTRDLSASEMCDRRMRGSLKS